MTDESSNYIGEEKQSSIPSCMIDEQILTRLFRELQKRNKESITNEIDRMEEQQEFNMFQENEEKSQIRELESVGVIINGFHGEQQVLYGKDALNQFEESKLPYPVDTITFDTALLASTKRNAKPMNRTEICLSFKNENLLNFSNPVDSSSLSSSYVNVIGDKQTWVRGTFKKCEEILEQNKLNRGWLHRSYIYNFLLFILGLPMAMWGSSYIYNFLGNFELNISNFYQVSITIYSALLLIFTFRIGFNFFRWLFPYLEIPGNVNSTMKIFRWLCVAIATSIIGFFISDTLGSLF